ncbi:hypothetical protein A2863_02130 [Candidatus Woesebacteria bacterium RIFCSPHIGHO2_01_FULL_38_9b]|uniref:Dockerin domain-containing protein n=1 Tax=Candidatus Woesebacteria bacterium RIFCSPHIGHO2_01_FULL_38_9b TaxID=1802493 RepID=A0A1F7Y6V1_9BACT|nr:MAG: hypothetical protein A2863_02130 [Candidatus Woesebacteria bacterium RIFCSPHIGHO2_01_FULL_38_9b]
MPKYFKNWSRHWRKLGFTQKISFVILVTLLFLFPISVILTINPKQLLYPRATHPVTPPTTSPVITQCSPQPTISFIPTITPFLGSSTCLMVTTNSFIDGVVKEPYRNFFFAEAMGYNVDPDLSLNATNLPPGLSVPKELCGTSWPGGGVKRIECALDGIPTTAGSYTVNITITDNLSVTVIKQVPINILPPVCNLTGDTNGDCIVNLLDYIVLYNNFGKTVLNGPRDADFDYSKRVDILDYAIWRINFGKTG